MARKITISGAGPAAAIILVLVLAATILPCGCTDRIGFPGHPGFPLPPQGSGGKLQVYFLDVGQGDSTLILFGNTTILIDAGETDAGDTVVSDLRTLGVSRIDLLVATHPHSDHIGGMTRVLDAFSVGQVLDTGMPHPSALYERFLETIDERNIRYMIARQGQTIDLDPALRILILSPPQKRGGDNLNENAIVLRISYGTVDFLFASDIGSETEKELEKTGFALDAEILKAGHHGSSSSTSPSFLSRVHPEVAIISLGSGNPYGHPHAETLDRLKTAGVAVFRTDRDKSILVSSDGSSYRVRTETETGSLQALARPDLTTAAPAGAAMPWPSPAITIPPVPENVTLPLPSFTIPVVRIGNASFVSIRAARFDAPGDDRLNLNGEWVQIANNGDEPVLLAGWTLSDRTSPALYTFPPFILGPDKTVNVHTGSGWFNDTALFMGKTEPVWGNSGDEAILKDASGVIVDRNSGGA